MRHFSSKLFLTCEMVHMLIATTFVFVVAVDKMFAFKYGKDRSVVMTVAATGAGKGGGLLERPTIETTSPGRESEFDLR